MSFEGTCARRGEVRHTSEEKPLSPWVVLGRGHLVLNVTQDRLGDLIQSLGSILQREGRGEGSEGIVWNTHILGHHHSTDRIASTG